MAMPGRSGDDAAGGRVVEESERKREPREKVHDGDRESPNRWRGSSRKLVSKIPERCAVEDNNAQKYWTFNTLAVLD